MPHYATGEIAQIGDYVRGSDGTTGPTFVGQVLEVTPGADACNATVATGGKPAQLSNGTIVLDGATTKLVTCSELELLHAAPQRVEADATGNAGTVDAADASGVAEEVGSGG